MIRSFRLLTVLAASALIGASALAAEALVVTGFSHTPVSAFDAQGKPLPALPASAFKWPVTSTEAGPGNTVGLPYQGKTVFVRRIDLALGKPPVCAKLAQPKAPSPGSSNGGERNSMGASTDCIIGAG
jgi:hypothetical protein